MNVNLYFISDFNKSAGYSSRQVLLSVLAKELGLSFLDASSVKLNHHGKPYLASGLPQRYFNLAHSKNYLALVTSSNEVGIDLEVARLKPPPHAFKWLAKLQLPPVPLNLDPSLAASYFLSWWTLIEALVKYFGASLFSWPQSEFNKFRDACTAAHASIWPFIKLSQPKTDEVQVTAIGGATPFALAWFSYLNASGWIVTDQRLDLATTKAYKASYHAALDLAPLPIIYR